jgi:iron complex outermembrane receptor protein
MIRRGVPQSGALVPVLLFALLTPPRLAAQPERATLVVTVVAAGVRVSGADVVSGTTAARTDGRGEARVEIAAGQVTLLVTKPGFAPAATTVTVSAGQELPVAVELVALPSVRETVTVSATRTDRGLGDQPMRVEVLDQDEIDEKLMMTPGDVVMMLNEMGGMRVQATSPSLGAASVRVQGMKGRYTRFLSDGLPLFGERVSLGLMQIPPMDLGRVEVIKGAASSLYGAGAIGGVVNLVSRRPPAKPERQLLVNRSSRGATDLAAWYAAPMSDTWGLSVLGSLNGHQRIDVDRDGWADAPRYERAVVRPRLYWDNHEGRMLFATIGGTWENRRGGSMPGTALGATGRPRVEALDTRRADAGASFQTVTATGVVWTARGSWTTRTQDHRLGEVLEGDQRSSGFAELTARRAVERHTLVAGAALQRDSFRPRERPDLAYVYSVPGVFAQDDIDVTRWLVVSGSARLDRHNRFGSFVSPHVSGIVRRGGWSSRVSYGAGFSAPTPIAEETDAAGRSGLVVAPDLRAERGRSASLDVTHERGPVSATLTLFRSEIRDPADVERTTRFVLANESVATTNTGIEALAIYRTEGISLVASYAHVRSRETAGGQRADVPLTPRHSIGLDAAWEWDNGFRLGVEWFYTGVQRLDANPYRDRSEPYSVIGILATRRFGAVLLFVNGENLNDVRQTKWDPLVRPTPGVDGRWTVDGWAPLEGRNINGGLRVTF